MFKTLWSNSCYDQDTVIYAIPNTGSATVNRKEIKKWLNDEYGWITGFTEMTKFRDDVNKRLNEKFNQLYNIVLFDRMNFIHYSIYGCAWAAKDNQTWVVVCSR